MHQEPEAKTAESAIANLPAGELDAVSGGAFPTAVNDQITDSVT